jgi:hypothetical protein
VMVSGKLCMVLYIDEPPYGSGPRRLVFGGADASAATQRSGDSWHKAWPSHRLLPRGPASVTPAPSWRSSHA